MNAVQLITQLMDIVQQDAWLTEFPVPEDLICMSQDPHACADTFCLERVYATEKHLNRFEEGLTKEPGGFSGRARLRLMARALMMLAFLSDCTARLLSSR